MSVLFNRACLPIKYMLNYKHRGRSFYLREMLRPFIWASVRQRNRGKKMIRVRRGRMNWSLPLYDSTISGSIYIHGHFNKEQVEQVTAFAEADRVLSPFFSKDRVLLDIGANYGTASLFFAQKRIFDRIHAIEPDPGNYAVLQENIGQNPTAAKITAHRLAISHVSGTAKFERSGNNSGDHCVRSGEKGKGGEIRVPCMTLDDFLEKEELKAKDIGLIWIDVQGHEAHALARSRALQQYPVPVFTEFWPYGLEKQGGLEDLLRFIRQNYSRFVELETRSGRPAESSVTEIEELARRLGTGGRATDILLCP